MDDQPRLLILDLDGTCVATTDCTALEHELVKKYGTDEGTHIIELPGYIMHTKMRPGLHKFLRAVKIDWKIGVWSAGTPAYVHKVVEAIFPKDIDIEFVMTAEHCDVRKICGYFGQTETLTKPLVKLWKETQHKFGQHNTLIVDDTATTYADNVDNALAIAHFDGEDDEDEELERILMELHDRKGKMI